MPVVATWFELIMILYGLFSEGNNGYIMVSANGGINQQRVAVSHITFRFSASFWCSSSCIVCRSWILQLFLLFCAIYNIKNELMLSCEQVCNAVAVARLLNATLVLPHFLFSSVWKDTRWKLTSYYVWNYFPISLGVVLLVALQSDLDRSSFLCSWLLSSPPFLFYLNLHSLSNYKKLELWRSSIALPMCLIQYLIYSSHAHYSSCIVFHF